MNDSNRRAFKIIQYNAQFALISWECNDENTVSSLCVGVCSGGPEQHFEM